MADGFIFYASFYEAISELDNESQLKVYQAVCAYALTGEEPEITGVASAMFKLMKPQIDANTKRRENGRRGGRPRTEEEPNENQTETEEEPNENQTITKAKPKEKDKVKDKDKEKVKEKDVSYDTSKKKVRHKYGEYGNVLLSDDQMEKLKDEFPDWEQRIENLSEYIASTGKKYKDHLATIRSWARKEKPPDHNSAVGKWEEFLSRGD